jgi:hypothetical protein
MPFDSHAEYWECVRIPARFDLVELLPAGLPKSIRFETKADVIERSLATENRLRKAGPGLQDMVESLADCRLGNCACRQPICPICARLFRRWFAADGMAIARKINNPVTLTLFCEAVPQGQLHRVDIAKLHDRVRQRFRRAGLGDIIAMGGTEVAHRAEQNDWLVHLHLLIGDLESSAEERLRAAWSKSDIRAPIWISPLVDPPQQIGYLVKFPTFHRPGAQSSALRARAYPLPQPRFEELACWYGDYEFSDFVFLLGARRRGGRIFRLNQAACLATRLRGYPAFRP